MEFPARTVKHRHLVLLLKNCSLRSSASVVNNANVPEADPCSKVVSR